MLSLASVFGRSEICSSSAAAASVEDGEVTSKIYRQRQAKKKSHTWGFFLRKKWLNVGRLWSLVGRSNMFKLVCRVSSLLAVAVALPAKAQMIVAVYSYSGPSTAVPTLSTPLLAALALPLGVVAARLLRQNGVKASSALMLVLSVGVAGVALNSARSDASGIIVNVSDDCQTGGTSSFYYPDQANYGGTYFQNSCDNAITIESINFTTGSCVLVPATNRETPDLPDCSPGLELAPGGRCDHLICQLSG